MPAPTQLSLYKGACLVLKQAPVESLSETVALVTILDAVWARDPIKACLQMGLWNFATRTQELYHESSITPGFGYRYAFTSPSDYVTMAAISADEYLDEPLKRYKHEAGYFWCDIEPIYLAYISDDNVYGRDYSKWPKNFEAFVEHFLANEAAPSVTGVDALDATAKMKLKLREAKGTDAREEASVALPRGTWSRARTAGREYDRSRSR